MSFAKLTKKQFKFIYSVAKKNEDKLQMEILEIENPKLFKDLKKNENAK